MRSLTQQFTDWVNTKPADEAYNACDGGACALFQFLSAAGYPVSRAGVYSWSDTTGDRHVVHGLGSEVLQHPWTFGALASRLSPNPTGRG